MKKLYSLIDKLYRKENLKSAFKHVTRNNGAPGIDGGTYYLYKIILWIRLQEINVATPR